MSRSAPENREVISVSQLNRTARRLLEGEFPTLWVEGEISNFSRPGSGHWYFTLKDEKAQHLQRTAEACTGNAGLETPRAALREANSSAKFALKRSFASPSELIAARL